PILVGIDGVDGSGKTTLADNMAKRIEKSGRQIIRISIDGFHNPSAIRYKQGKNSAKGYYQDSFNYNLLIDNLLEPLSTGNLEYLEQVFDYRTDKEVRLRKKKAGKDSILLMDGVFLFRPEIVDYWDIKVFLDVSFNEILSRVVRRTKDQETLGSQNEIIEKYENRYIPGQKLYFKEANPKEMVDILIDNADFDNPVIIRGW
ncbi:AAA family ATPase, partial [Candidatus Dojkabacteria bacterium]|nr:AAA family ATPase [Candidatus Dojkabacteria bacterium]